MSLLYLQAMKQQVKQISIKNLRFEELQDQLRYLGESKFRAKQIFNWIYDNLCLNFEEMKNLPVSLRQKLSQNFILSDLNLKSTQVSSDSQTIKYLFETNDGNKIESVLIPENNRKTLCISTQVGCPLDCKFCATGLMGYTRNLTAGEIIEQYLSVSRSITPDKITNIVYMGMGEPLSSNSQVNSVFRSLKILLHDLGNKIGRTRITVSTAGIPNKIIALADGGTRVKLALSLHSCFNEIRNKIMPINVKYNLEDNIDALRYYSKKTKTKTETKGL